MSRRASATGLTVLALVLAAAGCGGSGDDAAGDGGAGGGCEEAKAELLSTVSERDRLFVDLQLDNAAKACAEGADPGTEATCSAARADLAAAAEQETPPADLEARVDAAVEACIGTAITSTIPPP